MIIATICLAALSITANCYASSDKSEVLLRIKGNIKKFNSKDGQSYELTEKDLLALKSYEVKATTPFAPTSIFRGPRISDILKKSGINPEATTVIAKSFDGYAVKLPVTDFTTYEPVASLYRAGLRLTLETKGPVWIMYPIDQYPDKLSGPLTESKVVWALKEIEVQ